MAEFQVVRTLVNKNIQEICLCQFSIMYNGETVGYFRLTEGHPEMAFLRGVFYDGGWHEVSDFDIQINAKCPDFEGY